MELRKFKYRVGGSYHQLSVADVLCLQVQTGFASNRSSTSSSARWMNQTRELVTQKTTRIFYNIFHTFVNRKAGVIIMFVSIFVVIRGKMRTSFGVKGGCFWA